MNAFQINLEDDIDDIVSFFINHIVLFEFDRERKRYNKIFHDGNDLFKIFIFDGLNHGGIFFSSINIAIDEDLDDIKNGVESMEFVGIQIVMNLFNQIRPISRKIILILSITTVPFVIL